MEMIYYVLGFLLCLGLVVLLIETIRGKPFEISEIDPEEEPDGFDIVDQERAAEAFKSCGGSVQPGKR